MPTDTTGGPVNQAPKDALRPWRRIADVLTGPLGWPTHALSVWAVLWTGWDARFPGRGLTWDSLGTLLWAWVLLVWLTRPATGLVVRLLRAQPLGPLLAGWRHWLLAPILLGVTFAAIASGLPPRMAFRISRPALDRLAQEVLADRRRRPKQ